MEFYGEVLHLTTIWWVEMPAILHQLGSSAQYIDISRLKALYSYCLLPILPFALFPVPAILHHASPSAQYQSWMLYYFEEEECGRYL